MRNNAPSGADLQLLAFRPDHLGDVGAMDIHIADPHMPSLECQTHGEVGGDGALSDPALVAHDEHFVLDSLHPLRDEPAAMPFLVLLAGLILIAYRTGPHVGTGIAVPGPGMLDDVQFFRHCSFP